MAKHFVRMFALSLLGFCIVCSLPARPSLAQNKLSHDELLQPVAVRLTVANPLVMPGEPVILRWRVVNTISQGIFVTPSYQGKSCLDTTLQGPNAYSARVTDVSYKPDHLINNGGRNFLLGFGQYKEQDVVLRPEWVGKPSPGEYTLKVGVCLPYSLHEGGDGLYKQTFSIPIKVVATDPAALRKAAKASLKVAQDGSSPDGELAVATLFGFSEPYTAYTWRMLIAQSSRPKGDYLDYVNQLAKVQTPEMVEIMASQWQRASQRGDKWNALISRSVLLRMYPAATPILHQRIEQIVEQETGEALDRKKLLNKDILSPGE